jgi:hypothetical protein
MAAGKVNGILKLELWILRLLQGTGALQEANLDMKEKQ